MQVDSTLTIANLTPRSEMHGDEPKSACTVKLEGELPAGEVKRFFSTEASYERVLGTMWTERGDLTTTDVKSIPLTVQIIGGTAVMSTPFGEKVDFGQVKVDKVIVKPVAGAKCEVSMNMAATPDKESLWFLYSNMRNSVRLTCTPGQMSIEEEEESGDAVERDIGPVPQTGDLPFEPPASGDDADGGEDDPFAGMSPE